ncbi:MAG TPA: trehalose-6-phosphate synthase, partial [Duganella sp.]|uniref:alpha,alpha-trehalose-phosphate synthase (UDP-forming) n=1 Tax=Duganella sp. TaxID=1904440 RepID=UPI002ECFE11B
LGLGSARVILGVDRLDYTKGIPERLDAFALFLEKHPEELEQVTMVQIGVPSRVNMPEYQALGAAVEERIAAINARFGAPGRSPVHLITANLDFRELIPYYVLADVLAVTSLHDGMNLVAKEFIAARDDERGALVLSQFTGAARELHEALIINPYHIEQGAEALYRGLTMPPVEQRERMRSMRDRVRRFNVYRWAGHMLLDAARLRKREKVMQKIRSHSRGNLRRVG